MVVDCCDEGLEGVGGLRNDVLSSLMMAVRVALVRCQLKSNIFLV